MGEHKKRRHEDWEEKEEILHKLQILSTQVQHLLSNSSNTIQGKVISTARPFWTIWFDPRDKTIDVQGLLFWFKGRAYPLWNDSHSLTSLFLFLSHVSDKSEDKENNNGNTVGLRDGSTVVNTHERSEVSSVHNVLDTPALDAPMLKSKSSTTIAEIVALDPDLLEVLGADP